MNEIKKLTVLYNQKKVGYLALLDNIKIGFQYDEDWLKDGFSISPFSLPLTNKIFISNSPYFEGLFGVFYDSLPDGWGELVITRKLAKEGINYQRLSALTKLSLINDNGLGGLSYIPSQTFESEAELNDFDHYYKLVEDLLNDKDIDNLDDVYLYGASSGGARPKAHYQDWIIKFPTKNDGLDSGKKEFLANETARKCGINLPEYKLFPSKICDGFFGTKRFDRAGDKKIHMVSLAALLETTHRIPNMDYTHLFKVIEAICKDKNDLYEAFRIMCFNVFYQNKDDHSKNFSFIYDEDLNGYKLAPAYDLTHTPNKFEHEMTVNGSGNPSINDLLDITKKMKLSLNKCKEIIEVCSRLILKK